MRNFLRSCLLLLTMIGRVNGQASTDPVHSRFSRRVIPPSPEATQLGIYGNVSPDLQTGAVQLSIPLVTAQSRQLSLPISLNYHYTGLLVDEMPSWVGLGWTLSAGGIVTRTIQGTADEVQNKGYTSGGWLNSRQLHRTPNGRVEVDLRSMTPAAQTLATLCERVRQGDLDTEPDNYSLSLPGYSGSFFLDSLAQPFMGPHTDYRITGSPSVGWVVVTGDGTKYTFDAAEMVLPTDDAIGVESATAWYLSEIISADCSDTISLSYRENPRTIPLPAYTVIRKVFDPIISNTKCDSKLASYIAAPLVTSSNYPVTRTELTTVYLSRITTATTCITFFSDSLRADRDRLHDRVARRLNRVVVTDRYSNAVLQEFVLDQSYFNSTVADPVAKRFRLDAVREVGKPSHRFFYADGSFPSRFSLSKDHWGFYNASGASTLIPSLPPSIARFYRNTISSPGAQRTSNTLAAQLGVLQQVQYPTGGWTRFEYEGNQLSVPCPSPTAVGQFGEPGGAAGAPFIRYAAEAKGSPQIGTQAPNMTVTDIEQRLAQRYRHLDGTVGLPNVKAVRIDLPYGGIIGRVWINHNICFPGCSSGQDIGFSALYRENLDSVSTPSHFRELTPVCENTPGCSALNSQTNNCSLPFNPYPCMTSLSGSLPPGRYYVACGVAVSNPDSYVITMELDILPGPAPDVMLSSSPQPPVVPCYYSRIVGGLRVRRTTDYTPQGEVHVQSYKYDFPAVRGIVRSSGRLFVEPEYSYEDACGHLIVGASDVGKSNWLENGYHVGYARVVVEHDNLARGSTTYYYNNGNLGSSNAPALRSLVTRVEERNQAGQVVKSTTNEYVLLPIKQVFGLRLYPYYTEYGVITTTPFPRYDNYWLKRLSAGTYWPRLTHTTETLAGSQDTAAISHHTSYHYLPVAPNHTTQAVRISQRHTATEEQVTHLRFPGQYAAGPGTEPVAAAVDSLRARHLLDVPIEEQIWLRRQSAPTALADSTLLRGTLTHYSRYQPRRMYALATPAPLPASLFTSSSVQQGRFVADSRYQERVGYRFHPVSGVLLQQQLLAAPPTSYVWGYHNTRPIAEIKNAPVAACAFTSFEPASPGGWDYDTDHVNRCVSLSRTGQWGYPLNGSNPVSRIGIPPGNYELLLWATRAPLLTGQGLGYTASTPAIIATATIAGVQWQQFRYRLHWTATGSLSLSSLSAQPPAYLDEVRLHPSGAQMTSYTYDARGNPTSQADAAGRITIFEYDALGRLVRARDEQARILAQQEYHYARP
jgi:YD repeat-containing protein